MNLIYIFESQKSTREIKRENIIFENAMAAGGYAGRWSGWWRSCSAGALLTIDDDEDLWRWQDALERRWLIRLKRIYNF
jgi:hypothetical protein